jgi:hypothetical protein
MWSLWIQASYTNVRPATVIPERERIERQLQTPQRVCLFNNYIKYDKIKEGEEEER